MAMLRFLGGPHRALPGRSRADANDLGTSAKERSIYTYVDIYIYTTYIYIQKEVCKQSHERRKEMQDGTRDANMVFTGEPTTDATKTIK